MLDNKYKEAGAERSTCSIEEKLKPAGLSTLEAMSQSRDELDVAYIEAGSRYPGCTEHLQRELEPEDCFRQRKASHRNRTVLSRRLMKLHIVRYCKSNEQCIRNKVKLDKEIAIDRIFNTLGN